VLTCLHERWKDEVGRKCIFFSLVFFLFFVFFFLTDISFWPSKRTKEEERKKERGKEIRRM
jgi:hypothetical protein